MWREAGLINEGGSAWTAKALLCVVQKKSFTAAAAELRVTPSAVSQTVRALEDRVGVRLLARTTRNVGSRRPALNSSRGSNRRSARSMRRSSRSASSAVARPVCSASPCCAPATRRCSADPCALPCRVPGHPRRRLPRRGAIERRGRGLRCGHSSRPHTRPRHDRGPSQRRPTGCRRRLARLLRSARKAVASAATCMRTTASICERSRAARSIAGGSSRTARTSRSRSTGHVVTNDGAVLVDAAVDGLGLAYVFESMVRRTSPRNGSCACSTSTARRFPATFSTTRAG